jgi:hypothetical protein
MASDTIPAQVVVRAGYDSHCSEYTNIGSRYVQSLAVLDDAALKLLDRIE